MQAKSCMYKSLASNTCTQKDKSLFLFGKKCVYAGCGIDRNGIDVDRMWFGTLCVNVMCMSGQIQVEHSVCKPWKAWLCVSVWVCLETYIWLSPSLKYFDSVWHAGRSFLYKVMKSQPWCVAFFSPSWNFIPCFRLCIYPSQLATFPNLLYKSRCGCAVYIKNTNMHISLCSED